MLEMQLVVFAVVAMAPSVRVSCSAPCFSDGFFHKMKYDLLMWNFVLSGMLYSISGRIVDRV